MSGADEILEESQDMWEMVVLGPNVTGLRKLIYASPDQGDHGPGIKINISGEKIISGQWYPISVSDNPEPEAEMPKEISANNIKDVQEWIRLNKDVLMQLWDGKIFEDESNE